MNHIEFFEKHAFDTDLSFEIRNALKNIQLMKLEEANQMAVLISDLVRLKNEDNQAISFYTKMAKLDKELNESNVVNF